MLFRTICDK